MLCPQSHQVKDGTVSSNMIMTASFQIILHTIHSKHSISFDTIISTVETSLKNLTLSHFIGKYLNYL
jgi:hypothetical protein